MIALLLVLILTLPPPQEANALPEAGWVTPGQARVVWWQTEAGEACLYRRRAGIDTALGCVAGAADRNERIEIAEPGDLFWVAGYGAALPLEDAPQFLFFPGMIYE